MCAQANKRTIRCQPCRPRHSNEPDKSSTCDAGPNAPGAPRSVQVVRGVCGARGVVHEADGWKIEAPRSRRRRNQQAGLVVPKSMHRLERSDSNIGSPFHDFVCSAAAWPKARSRRQMTSDHEAQRSLHLDCCLRRQSHCYCISGCLNSKGVDAARRRQGRELLNQTCCCAPEWAPGPQAAAPQCCARPRAHCAAAPQWLRPAPLSQQTR